MAVTHKLAAISRLSSRLSDARQLYDLAGDGGRTGAMAALDAVTEFLGAVGQDEALRMPLLTLWGALNDLSQGIVTPMLKPLKLENREPVAYQDHVIRALAAYTVDLLAHTGMKMETEGAQAVAKVLHECGYTVGGNPVSKIAKLVWNWRDAYRRSTCVQPGKQVYDSAPQAYPYGGETASQLLERLRRFVAATYPQGAREKPHS